MQKKKKKNPNIWSQWEKHWSKVMVSLAMHRLSAFINTLWLIWWLQLSVLLQHSRFNACSTAAAARGGQTDANANVALKALASGATPVWWHLYIWLFRAAALMWTHEHGAQIWRQLFYLWHTCARFYSWNISRGKQSVAALTPPQELGVRPGPASSFRNECLA